MSKKRKNIWRKIKKVAILLRLFIPTILTVALSSIVLILISLVIHGGLISICWNIAMTTMFVFNKITIFQAIILAFAIGGIKTNYISDAKLAYKKTKKEISKKYSKENKIKALSLIIAVLMVLISILITVWTLMYSWNNIIPQLLNIELAHINIAEAFCFAYLLNLILGTSKTNDYSEKNNHYKEETHLANNNIEETIEIDKFYFED